MDLISVYMTIIFWLLHQEIKAPWLKGWNVSFQVPKVIIRSSPTYRNPFSVSFCKRKKKYLNLYIIHHFITVYLIILLMWYSIFVVFFFLDKDLYCQQNIEDILRVGGNLKQNNTIQKKLFKKNPNRKKIILVLFLFSTSSLWNNYHI